MCDRWSRLVTPTPVWLVSSCFFLSPPRTSSSRFPSSLQATLSIPSPRSPDMLALAPHPMHTPVDIPHRTQPSTPSSSTRPPYRKVTPTYSASSSSSHGAHSAHQPSRSTPLEASSSPRRAAPQRTPSFVSAQAPVYDGHEDDPSTPPGSESEDNEPEPAVRSSPAPVDIHAYDSSTLLHLLAAALSEIASMNTDRDHSEPYMTSSVHPHSTVSEPHPPIWRTLTSASRHALSTTSSLAFHARNVPTIALEAYLTRIQKYCPASNEVFLSLLVYFDRMMKLAKETCGKVFAIDMYNVHRLVIAGVTVASKFFSDVFYTNSRYAKVRMTMYSFVVSTMLMTIIVGWWASAYRAQPTGAPVPALERLPPHDFARRDAILCEQIGATVADTRRRFPHPLPRRFSSVHHP